MRTHVYISAIGKL